MYGIVNISNKTKQKGEQVMEKIIYRNREIEVIGSDNKIYRVWDNGKFRDFYKVIEAETYIDYLVDTFF